MSTFREGKPEDSIEGATCTSCGRSDDKKTRTEYRKTDECKRLQKEATHMTDEEKNGNAKGEAPVGLTAIPKDKLAEGVLKMFRENGYPHVMLAFADVSGAYWATHTGSYQVYRLHRLLGVALDEVQARLDRPTAAPTPGVATPEKPE